MSFNIVLQKNNSEKNKFSKSITDVLTCTGNLKSESSIIDPIIVIDGNLTNLNKCNYCTINEFGRKYFINDIKSVANRLIEIYLHVDVLSSFSSEILANYVILERQQNTYNLYLNDGVFKIYQDPIVTTHEFPNGFTTDEFILALAGH